MLTHRTKIVRPYLWEVLSQDFVFPLEFLFTEPGSDPGIWLSGDLSEVWPHHHKKKIKIQWMDGWKMLNSNKFHVLLQQTGHLFLHSPSQPWLPSLNNLYWLSTTWLRHIVHMKVKRSFPLTLLPLCVLADWRSQRRLISCVSCTCINRQLLPLICLTWTFTSDDGQFEETIWASAPHWSHFWIFVNTAVDPCA